MSKNLIKKVITFLTFVLTVFALASCGETNNSGNGNANEDGRYLVHFDRVEPTCVSEGRIEFWYDIDSREYFSDEAAKTKITKADTVLATVAHNYGSATYSWAFDNSSCTAEIKCSVCGDVQDSETVTTTSEVTLEPTVDEYGEMTYTATFTKAAFTTQTKVVQLDKLEDNTNYGSLAQPLSVTEAWNIANTQCKSHGDFSNQQVYVRGIANTNPVINEEYFSSFDLTDGTKTLIIYSSNKTSSCSEIYQNDTVTIHGYLQKFSNNLEIATKTVSDTEKYQPEALNRTAGQGSATAVQSARGTLAVSPATGTNGTEFTITATPDEDCSVLNVKANGVELTANNDGSYTGIFAGAVSVTATFKDNNAVETKVASYDFSSSDSADSLEPPAEGDDDNLLAFFDENADKTGNLSNVVTQTSNVSKVYKGDNTAKNNGVLGLKTGTGSYNGTFTLKTNTAITKAVITGYSWTTSDKLSLNGEEASLGGPYATADAVEVTFLLEPTKTLNFVTTKRIIIEKIELYTASYRVRFYNEDGSALLYDHNFAAGVIPSFDGEEPTKAQDAQYTYAFADAWAAEPNGEALSGLPAVSASVKYYAVFTPTLRQYTVNFIGADGTTSLDSHSAAYGSVPAYAGAAAPEKAADNDNNYEFAGWALEANGEVLTALPAVEGDATFYAIFTAVPKDKYVVKWMNGTEVLKTSAQYSVGQPCTETYDGETPVKASDAQYDYTFVGWSPEEGSVTEATTYVAQFTPVLRQYAITFYEEDGTTPIGEPQLVNYGELPVTTGLNPAEKAPSYDLTNLKLHFYSWEGDFTTEVVAVTGNASYTVQYADETRDLETFSTGFETSDGFPQASSYSDAATETEFGTSPYTVLILHGSMISTSSSISGQSIMFRYYTNSSTAVHTIRSGFAVEEVMYMTFDARATAAMENAILVQYSTDGGTTWSAGVSKNVSTTTQNLKIEFVEDCNIDNRLNMMVKFTAVYPSNAANKTDIVIDNICFYTLVLNDEEGAAKVIDKIEALPAASAITISHKAAVEAVEAAYNALTAEGKALVTNKAKLDDVRTALNAAIEAAKRTVTYLAWGGQEIDSIIVDYEDKLEKPTDPVIAGRTFIGWSADHGATLWDFNNDVVTENIQLKAYFTVSIDEFIAAADAENYYYVVGYVGMRRYSTGKCAFVLVQEDGTAIYQFDSSSIDATVGNKIILKGQYDVYRALDEIKNSSIYEVLSDSTTLPSITVTDVSLAALEEVCGAATDWVNNYDNKLIRVTGYWYNGGLVSDTALTTYELDTYLTDTTYPNGTRVTIEGYITSHYIKDSNNNYLRLLTILGNVTDAEGIRFASSTASVAVGATTSVNLNMIGTPTGTVVYSANPTSVATVNAETGDVTGVAEGEATITATLGSYSVSYTITVQAAGVTTATLSNEGFEATTTAAALTTAGTLTTSLGLDDEIFTVTYNKNGAGTEMTIYTDNIRMYATKNTYKGNYFTVSVASGYTISKIVINYVEGNSSTAEVFVGSVTVTSNQVTGTQVTAGTDGKTYEFDSAQTSFTLYNNNKSVSSNTQVRFTSIVIYYDAD